MVASGPNWQMKDFLTNPASWQYVKSIYVTRDNGATFAFATGDQNTRVLYEDRCANSPGSQNFEPCTMSVFNIHHIACTPSGDTVFIQDGAADGSNIDFSPMVAGQVKCLVSIDAGLSWQVVFKETPGNNLGHMDLFCDPALPTGMRLFLGSSRYTDSAGPVASFMQPDSIGYGELNRTPATIDLMVPGAQVWIGLSEVGPFVTTGGINGRFRLCLDGLEAMKIYDIAQLPDHPDTVFLATHMGLAATKVYTNAAIAYADKWRGVNGAYGLFNGEVKLVAINPNDPTLVVAVDMNGFRVANGAGSLFDEGGWVQKRIVSVENTPSGSVKHVYVTGLDYDLWSEGGGEITGIAFLGRDTVLASFSATRSNLYGGLMQSFNRGQTWEINTAVPDSCANDVAVAVDGAGNTVVVVAYGTERNNPSWGFLVKSEGDLSAWTRLSPAIRYQNTQQSFTQVAPVNEIEFAPGQTDTAYLVLGRYPAITLNCLDSLLVVNSIGQNDANRSGFTSITVNKSSHDSAFYAQGKIIWCVDIGNTVDDGKGGVEAAPLVSQYFVSLPGEVIYDVLYDDLTMSSSNGFYAIEKNMTTPLAPKAKAKSGTGLSLAAAGSAGRYPVLRYFVPSAGEVRLSLYDIRGRIAGVLVNKRLAAGTYSLPIDGRRVSAGRYVVRLDCLGRHAVVPLTITR